MVTSVSQAMHVEKIGRIEVRVANPGNASKNHNETFHAQEGAKKLKF